MAAPLPAALLLEARERAARLHPIDRALLVLALAGGTGEDLAALPLAERDRRLIALRRATFGDRIACLAECPACGESLAFDLAAGRLLDGIGTAPEPESLALSGWEIALRPIDSRDLAAAALTGDRKRAAATLVRRVMAVTRRPAEAEAGAEIPETVLEIAEAHIGDREAVCDIAVELQCVSCGAAWTAGFDIGAHLWEEIDAAARRLIGEVATLARWFGWSEADILAMPATRRHAYLAAQGLA
jgi:hypothetical protein